MLAVYSFLMCLNREMHLWMGDCMNISVIFNVALFWDCMRRLRYSTAPKNAVRKTCEPWNLAQICCHCRCKCRSRVLPFDKAEQNVSLHGPTFVFPVVCSPTVAACSWRILCRIGAVVWLRFVCINVTFWARSLGTVNPPSERLTWLWRRCLLTVVEIVRHRWRGGVVRPLHAKVAYNAYSLK